METNYSAQAQFQYTRDSHKDYLASKYFKALGVPCIAFETREVKCGDARVALVNFSGFSDVDGCKVDVDLWPQRCQTLKDLESLPLNPKDIVFRIGYWSEVDPTTGEVTVKQGKPKVLAWFDGTKFVKFTGKPAIFDEATKRTAWSNEDPNATEAEKASEGAPADAIEESPIEAPAPAEAPAAQ